MFLHCISETVSYDSYKIFDLVAKDEKLPLKTKLNYLYGLFNEISMSYSNEELDARKAQFLELAEDTTWSKIVDKIDRLETIDSKDLILYDRKMNKVKFDDLMDNFKDKVVYVDLWASWCAPCIASFSYADGLKEEYKDKPVVFLYLGYNDLEKAWLAKDEAFQLTIGNSHSYLIATPKATWLKDLEVKSIPRYLLYNKQGKLVNRNAPSPKGENIREVLDGLLE